MLCSLVMEAMILYLRLHNKIRLVGVCSNHLLLPFELLQEMMDFTASYYRISLLLIITAIIAYCLELMITTITAIDCYILLVLPA